MIFFLMILPVWAQNKKQNNSAQSTQEKLQKQDSPLSVPGKEKTSEPETKKKLPWLIITVSAVIAAGFIYILTRSSSKSSNETDNSPKYKYDVEVTYNRDVRKIRLSNGNDEGVYLFGGLYDPQVAGNNEPINIKMTKIAENQFNCIIPKIWVNTSSAYHVVKVSDPKLLIPGDSTFLSCKTGEDIDIVGIRNQKIVSNGSGGSELWFMIE